MHLWFYFESGPKVRIRPICNKVKTEIWHRFEVRPEAQCDDKLGCVVRMAVDSILPHAESGPNDHRKDAHQFTEILQKLLWAKNRIPEYRLAQAHSCQVQKDDLGAYNSQFVNFPVFSEWTIMSHCPWKIIRLNWHVSWSLISCFEFSWWTWSSIILTFSPSFPH